MTAPGEDRGDDDARKSDSYVFVSHCRKDHDIVVHLLEALRSQRVRYWIDFEVIGTAETTWASSVERAIGRSSSVLFVLSPNSRRCQNCRYELGVARTSQRPVHILDVAGEGCDRVKRMPDRAMGVPT